MLISRDLALSVFTPDLKTGVTVVTFQPDRTAVCMNDKLTRCVIRHTEEYLYKFRKLVSSPYPYRELFSEPIILATPGSGYLLCFTFPAAACIYIILY